MGISALYVVLTIVCNLFELELELEQCSPPKVVRGIVLRATQVLNFVKFQFLGEQLKKNGLYTVFTQSLHPERRVRWLIHANFFSR